MTRMVQIERYWINPDLVTYVYERHAGSTAIILYHDDVLYVDIAPTEVVALLEGRK